MKICILAITWVFSGLLYPFPAMADPVAMVTDLKGDAWHGGDRSLRLNMLHYFEAPTQVRLAPQSTLSVTYFANPVQYVFKGPALLTIETAAPRLTEGAPPDTRRVGPEKGIGGGLTRDQWRRLQQAAIVMRAVRASFVVISPNQTSVLSPNIELSWTPVDGVTGYRVMVSDDADKPLADLPTASTTIHLPESVRLQKGMTYRWKVDAILPSDTLTAFGVFDVASTDIEQKFAQLRPAPDAELAAQVYFATLLDIEGFAYDARVEWRRLAKLFPEERAITRRAQ